MVEISYDSHAEVLYVTKENNREGYAYEDEGGVILRKALDNDEFLSATFLFPMEWVSDPSKFEKKLSELFEMDFRPFMKDLLDKFK